MTFEDNDVQQMIRVEHTLLSVIRDVETRFETLANCYPTPCLRHIVKPISRFLHVDVATAKFTRPNVAKIKFGIDLMKPIRQKIFIHLGSNQLGRKDFGFWQYVKYERIHHYCLTC